MSEKIINSTLSYAKSGVNRDKADLLVQSITGMAKKTLDKKVASHVGGYASIYKLGRDQWIAASTDGVGTKLKLAFQWNQHDHVGQDLVAMSVNDLLCVGARPLFFLDYFATGKLDNEIAKRVIQGIANGCKLAGCALVGGETAEMPGMYADGEYDLAGFAVGSLLPKQVLPGKVKAGDVLIGIESSGFHSNGFSLIRKILETLPTYLGPFSSTQERDEAIMKPTHIYCKTLLPLIQKKLIKGAAHITGSGFLNVPRISTQVDYQVQLPPLTERAKVYSWLNGLVNNLEHGLGTLSFEEAVQTYNMGIGMVLVVERKSAKKVLALIKKQKMKVWMIGETLKKKKGSSSSKQCTVRVSSAEGKCDLIY